MNTYNKKKFVEEYVKALKEKNAAVFAGAGLSRSAGYVDWKGLLKRIADGLGLNIDKENDLIALTQYHCNERNGNRGELNQLLIEKFSQKAELTDNHKILARLPIETYWTTNYDKMIERALDNTNKTPDVKFTKEQLATTEPKRDAIVYKMHGDISMPNEAVLTKDDYEKYHLNRELFSTTLRGDLITKTFLFLGFSFTDPNLDLILSRVRVLLGNNQRTHYCIFKSEKKNKYRKLQQEYKIKDLQRFAINTILINDYNEISEILKEIEASYKNSIVFISGSADEYGSWGEAKARFLIHKLSKELSKNDYKVISGFGEGIGSYIINGVLEHVFSTKYRSIDEYLMLNPFPQKVSGNIDQNQLYNTYRKEFIPNAGIAIFLFGNKTNAKGNIVLADGVENEFDIAVQNGLKVIPIGVTGYVAQKLWEKVINEYEKYYDVNDRVLTDIKSLDKFLNKPDKLVKLIVKIVNTLNRR